MELAIVGGDGIGPEVVAEAVKVLDAVLPGVHKTTYDLGARRYHATGELLPESVLAELREHDGILLGAVGDPSVPSGVLERGLLLRLRFELDHHVNLRPGRLYPGVSSPLAGDPKIDFVVVREGTEGPYTGNGGAIRDATRTNPSMFEPVHGSAPDIAGQGIADPTAAIMSVALLLAHLGEDAAAARVDRAVASHLASRPIGKISTAEVGERIASAL